MALEPHHIRMSELLWAQVKKASRAEGVSASEFVRQAILARLVWSAASRARRKGVDLDQALKDARVMAEQLLLAEEEAAG